MLRAIDTAFWSRRATLSGWRYFVVEGSRDGSATWRSGAFRRLEREQWTRPVALFERGRRCYWAFEGRFFWEDEGLDARDVLALVRARQRRQRRRLEHAHAALAGESGGARREAIPRALRQAVWERSGGRCVDCGSRFDIQYDHVIPVALGGATSAENLQILCRTCNQRKGAALA